MAIKKTDKGWQADFRLDGAGSRRIRKVFKTKTEASQYEVWAKNNANQNRAWTPQKKDTRRLAELIDIWFTHCGIHLKKGEERQRYLKQTILSMGNPIAAHFEAKHFTQHRKTRLDAGTSANTINHEHAYLRGMINDLIRLDEWHYDNPLSKIKKLKYAEKELSYLTSDQIKQLLNELDQSKNQDVGIIARICLSTGARWTEAETLRREHIKNNKITFTDTKNTRVRTVPIPRELSGMITNKAGRLFIGSYQAFGNALMRSGIVAPERQRTHILRHTFASHFIMNGGDLLTLSKILGHSDVKQTMRYAHLAPDHFEQAILKNPISMDNLWTAKQKGL